MLPLGPAVVPGVDDNVTCCMPILGQRLQRVATIRRECCAGSLRALTIHAVAGM